MKHLERLEKMINVALKKMSGWKKDPLQNEVTKYEKRVLTQRIGGFERKDFRLRLQFVKDFFYFQLLIGLSYTDTINNLRPTNLIRGNMVIIGYLQRQKTGTPVKFCCRKEVLKNIETIQRV